MTHVIDASVAIKWFAEEEGSMAARQWIGTPLVAPDIMLAELGNAMWKKWRKQEISEEQARLTLGAAGSFVTLLPSLPLADAALDIGIELSHPIYDCFYLALAEATGRPILTADKRLAGACQKTRFSKMLILSGSA